MEKTLKQHLISELKNEKEAYPITDEPLLSVYQESENDQLSHEVSRAGVTNHHHPLTEIVISLEDCNTRSDKKNSEAPQLNRKATRKLSIILKTILSAGSILSIMSLSILNVVANIDNAGVAFAFTSPIQGLIVVCYVLYRLRKKPSKKGLNHEYKQALEDGLNYLLHRKIVFLSLLLFSILPTLAYTFAFPETDYKDLKTVAAMGATFPCYVLLAIVEAHLQKLENWKAYTKILLLHITFGVVCFGSLYLVGYLLGEFIVMLKTCI